MNRPYVTDVPSLWARNREGYPKGALWTNGKELYSYGLLIGDTFAGGRKRLFCHTRSDGTGEKFRSMTTSQHVGMARQWADVIMVYDGKQWVTEQEYEAGTALDPCQTRLPLIVQRDDPDIVMVRRGDVEVEVAIHEKPPHEGWVAIRVPGAVGRNYPIHKRD